MTLRRWKIINATVSILSAIITVYLLFFLVVPAVHQYVDSIFWTVLIASFLYFVYMLVGQFSSYMLWKLKPKEDDDEHNCI